MHGRRESNDHVHLSGTSTIRPERDDRRDLPLRLRDLQIPLKSRAKNADRSDTTV